MNACPLYNSDAVRIVRWFLTPDRGVEWTSLDSFTLRQVQRPDGTVYQCRDPGAERLWNTWARHRVCAGANIVPQLDHRC